MLQSDVQSDVCVCPDRMFYILLTFLHITWWQRYRIKIVREEICWLACATLSWPVLHGKVTANIPATLTSSREKEDLSQSISSLIHLNNNSHQVNKFSTSQDVPISSSYSPTGIRRDRGWDANSNGSYLSLEDFSPFQRFLHVCQWTRRKTCSMFQYSIC